MAFLSRYSVTMDGTAIRRITEFQVYKFPRVETRTTSFAGTDRVDRSAIKYRLRFKISFCTEAEMKDLVALSEKITVSVTFYDGSQSVTKTMIVDMPEIPQPIYKYDRRTNGVYYSNIYVDAEEV